jgi:hypothetical protein
MLLVDWAETQLASNMVVQRLSDQLFANYSVENKKGAEADKTISLRPFFH